MWDTHNCVVGLEFGVLSAFHGAFLAARRTLSFASSSPGEGLAGGLLEGSCGRRKRVSMPNLLNVGMYARLLIQKCYHLLSNGGERYGLAK